MVFVILERIAALGLLLLKRWRACFSNYIEHFPSLSCPRLVGSLQLSGRTLLLPVFRVLKASTRKLEILIASEIVGRQV
ncbi:hypothetical protein B0O99DRAFT_644776 [Bisporella sp. PMI_857]|nr:hypothetical protein B0O99DRAFT_644776 [Bisporella sp. PMI_857]